MHFNISDHIHTHTHQDYHACTDAACSQQNPSLCIAVTPTPSGIDTKPGPFHKCPCTLHQTPLWLYRCGWHCGVHQTTTMTTPNLNLHDTRIDQDPPWVSRSDWPITWTHWVCTKLTDTSLVPISACSHVVHPSVGGAHQTRTTPQLSSHDTNTLHQDPIRLYHAWRTHHQGSLPVCCIVGQEVLAADVGCLLGLDSI